MLGGGGLSLPTLVQRIQVDATGVASGEAAAQSSFTRLAAGSAKVGKALTIGVTLPILAAGVATVSAASDMNESMSKVSVVFGDSASDIVAWSKTSASAMGLSQQAALEAAGTFGNFFQALGVSRPAAADMSKSVIQLAADLASFNNQNPEDVLVALRSGLSGEVEPLRKFGIALSQTAIQAEAVRLGLVKSTADQGKLDLAQRRAKVAQDNYTTAVKKYGAESAQAQRAAIAQKAAEQTLSTVVAGKVPELTAAQKAQATYSLIMAQSTLAQGDFARTSNGLANQQRILSATVSDLKAQFGQSLLPVAQKVTSGLVRLLSAVRDLSPETKTMIVNALKVAAALGPALFLLGKAPGILGAVRSGLNSVKTGLQLVGSASPWMVAIAVAGYLVYRNWNTIRPVLTRLLAPLRNVGEYGKAAWEGIQGASSKAVRFFQDSAAPRILGAARGLARGVGSAYTALAAGFSGDDPHRFFGTLGNSARGAKDYIVGTAVPGIVGAAKTMASGVVGAGQDIAAGFSGDDKSGFFGAIGNSARATYDFVVGTVVPGLRSAVGSFVSGFTGKGEQGRSFFTDLGNVAGKAWGIIQRGAGIVRAAVPPAIALVRRAFGAIGDFVVQRLFPAFSGLARFVGQNKLVFGTLAVAVGLLASPFATVAAGFVVLYQKSQAFRNVVAAVVGFVQTKVLPTYKALALGLLQTYGRVLTFVAGKVLPVLGKVGEAIVAGLRVATPFVNRVLGGILRGLGSLVAFFQEIAPQVREAIGHIVNVVRAVLTPLVTVVKIALAPIALVFVAAFLVIRTVVRTGLRLVAAIWESVGSHIWGIVKAVFNQVKNTIETAVHLIADIIRLVLAVINGDWGKAWDAVKSIVGDVFGWVNDTVRNGLSVLGNALAGVAKLVQTLLVFPFQEGRRLLGEAIDQAVDFVKNLPGRLLGFAQTIFDAAKSLGGKILDGLASGVTSAVGFVADFAKGIGSAVIGWVNRNIIDKINDAIPDKLDWGPIHIDLPDSVVPQIPTPKALGGNVRPGQPYLVGEKGPELATFGMSGSIVPNDVVRRALGAPETVRAGDIYHLHVEAPQGTRGSDWGRDIMWGVASAKGAPVLQGSPA